MSSPQDQLVQLDFAEEMKTSFRDYALSVILARALPDVRAARRDSRLNTNNFFICN